MTSRPSRNPLDHRIALLIATAPVALTSMLFAALALAPGLFGERGREALALTGVAEGPLLVLDYLLVGVLGMTMHTRGRLMVAAVLLLPLAGGAFGMLFHDPVIGPILLWAVFSHLIALAKPGEDRRLRVQRGQALCRDMQALLVMALFVLALGAAIFVYRALPTGDGLEDAPWWQLVGGVGCAYFALRAASIAHVHRRAFEAHPKRLLDRRGLRWMARDEPEPYRSAGDMSRPWRGSRRR